MTDKQPGEDAYLFVVAYSDDAERKRAEYLFNNWEDGDVDAPDGLVRFVSGADHDELYERLVGKVPESQVESFRIEPIEADVTPERHTVKETVNAPPETVETFVEYALSKKKAVLQSAAHNQYELYTKKGRANITYRLDETADGTNVSVSIEGYPPAPAFLADFFKTELNDYARSQA